VAGTFAAKVAGTFFCAILRQSGNKTQELNDLPTKVAGTFAAKVAGTFFCAILWQSGNKTQELNDLRTNVAGTFFNERDGRRRRESFRR
jgi:hypothetical protein